MSSRRRLRPNHPHQHLSRSERRGWQRRGVLAAVSSAAVVSLAGCASILGQPDPDGDAPAVSAGDGEGSDADDSNSGRTTDTAEPATTSGDAEQDETSREPSEHSGEVIDGPVDSPPTNDHPWVDDPADGLGLTEVTLSIGTDRTRDFLGTEPDELSISVDDDRFTVDGRGHLEWDCDGFALAHVLVDDRTAEVYVEAAPNDACRTSDNDEGRGPWVTPFTVTGRFTGGRPDALEVHLEGQYIEGDGPRGGAFARASL